MKNVLKWSCYFAVMCGLTFVINKMTPNSKDGLVNVAQAWPDDEEECAEEYEDNIDGVKDEHTALTTRCSSVEGRIDNMTTWLGLNDDPKHANWDEVEDSRDDAIWDWSAGVGSRLEAFNLLGDADDAYDANPPCMCDDPSYTPVHLSWGAEQLMWFAQSKIGVGNGQLDNAEIHIFSGETAAYPATF